MKNGIDYSVRIDVPLSVHKKGYQLYMPSGRYEIIENGNIFHSSWNNSIQALTPMHDDVIKWKYFPRYWPFVRGIHWQPMNSPHKGQWRGALMYFLSCACVNGWMNNGEAGGLRRHRIHYDVTVMMRALWVCYPHEGHAGATHADDTRQNGALDELGTFIQHRSIKLNVLAAF